jgi:hypothetical protein
MMQQDVADKWDDVFKSEGNEEGKTSENTDTRDEDDGIAGAGVVVGPKR